MCPENNFLVKKWKKCVKYGFALRARVKKKKKKKINK